VAIYLHVLVIDIVKELVWFPNSDPIRGKRTANANKWTQKTCW